MSRVDARLLAALRRRLGADAVRDDPAQRIACESDALTLFRSRPAAVVAPRDRDGLCDAVRMLHDAGVPFAPRGAGTGLSGGALPPPGGVVLSTARLDRIVSIEPDVGRAVVEPGVVNAELSRRAARFGLRYAPDPASQITCTLGGNVAENAGGPRCFRYGTTTHHVLALEVVLADGRREVWGNPTAESDDLDLRGLAIGSEGALAVVVSAVVRLLPIPEAVETLLAAYPDVASSCHAVADVVAAGFRPAAMEVMDRLAIRAVEDSHWRAGLPTDAGSVLIVELEGAAERVAADVVEVEALLRARGPTRLERARDEAQRRALWKGRKGAGGALGRLAPDAYVMDGVVPRSRLAEVMAFVAEVEAETGLPVANLFHAGDGNIHPHFAYDARDEEQVARVERAGARILRKCLELGGSLSGEHGIGLEKQHLLELQFDTATLEAMRRIGAAFDPNGVLNPDKGLPLPRGCAEAFHRHGRASAR